MDNLDEKELARAIFGDESDEEEERKEVEEAQEEQGEPKIDERTLDLQDDLEEPRDAGEAGTSEPADEPRKKQFNLRIKAPFVDGVAERDLFVTMPTAQFDVFCQPFDGTIDMSDMEYVDRSGRKRVRLSHYSGVRWRFEQDEDGNLALKSNARLVTWSDGSQHLVVGDTYFEVQRYDMGADAGFLYANVGRGVSQCLGQMRQQIKLTLPPDARVSRLLLSRVTQARVKERAEVTGATARVAVEARERAKIEREQAAMAERRRRQEILRAQRERGAAAAARPRREQERFGLTAEFLEEGEDDEDRDFVVGEDEAMEDLRRVDRDDERERALESIRSAKRGREVAAEPEQKRHRGRYVMSDDED